MGNPVDLGLFVRDLRRRRRMSQAQLCAIADVSRRWLSDFEAGKPTAEIGLVFKVIHSLGQALEVAPRDAPDFDLDDVLRAYGQDIDRHHDR